MLRNARGFVLLVAVIGCTWVPLTSEGEKVRIRRASEVAACEKLGTTTSNTADRVVIFARTDRKVHEELESLARNEAAEMGGDTVVPTGPVSEGRQGFDVYRCGSG